jgi:hypothetical protein
MIERSLVRHNCFPIRERVTLRKELQEAPIAFDLFGFVLTSVALKQIAFSTLALAIPAIIKLALPRLYE